jgi:hypothetical protein
VDQNQLSTTILCIPKTKVAPNGEDIYWSKQNDPTDPEAALANHLEVNAPPPNAHIFSYKHQVSKVQQPLTKSEFNKVITAATWKAGLQPIQGHGIHIGSTLEYLLQDIPFEAMKAKGRWASDAFSIYLTKHAQVLAPYIQASPTLHDAFLQVMIPHTWRGI